MAIQPGSDPGYVMWAAAVYVSGEVRDALSVLVERATLDLIGVDPTAVAALLTEARDDPVAASSAPRFWRTTPGGRDRPFGRTHGLLPTLPHLRVISRRGYTRRRLGRGHSEVHHPIGQGRASSRKAASGKQSSQARQTNRPARRVNCPRGPTTAPFPQEGVNPKRRKGRSIGPPLAGPGPARTMSG